MFVVFNTDCLTCKTNKIRTINHEDVQAALGSEHFPAGRLDDDASITRYLALKGAAQSRSTLSTTQNPARPRFCQSCYRRMTCLGRCPGP